MSFHPTDRLTPVRRRFVRRLNSLHRRAAGRASIRRSVRLCW